MNGFYLLASLLLKRWTFEYPGSVEDFYERFDAAIRLGAAGGRRFVGKRSGLRFRFRRKMGFPDRSPAPICFGNIRERPSSLLISVTAIDPNLLIPLAAGITLVILAAVKGVDPIGIPFALICAVLLIRAEVLFQRRSSEAFSALIEMGLKGGAERDSLTR